MRLTAVLQSGMPNDNTQHHQALNQARLMNRCLRSRAGPRSVGVIRMPWCGGVQGSHKYVSDGSFLRSINVQGAHKHTICQEDMSINMLYD